MQELIWIVRALAMAGRMIHDVSAMCVHRANYQLENMTMARLSIKLRVESELGWSTVRSFGRIELRNGEHLKHQQFMTSLAVHPSLHGQTNDIYCIPRSPTDHLWWFFVANSPVFVDAQRSNDDDCVARVFSLFMSSNREAHTQAIKHRKKRIPLAQHHIDCILAAFDTAQQSHRVHTKPIIKHNFYWILVSFQFNTKPNDVQPWRIYIVSLCVCWFLLLRLRLFAVRSLARTITPSIFHFDNRLVLKPSIILMKCIQVFRLDGHLSNKLSMTIGFEIRWTNCVTEPTRLWWSQRRFWTLTFASTTNSRLRHRYVIDIRVLSRVVFHQRLFFSLFLLHFQYSTSKLKRNP